MLKFGSPSITLSLLVQNCTVKAGCTVAEKIGAFFSCYLVLTAIVTVNNQNC